MDRFLAIDGGGTKTDALIFDREGNVLVRALGPGCNPNDRGFDAACQALGETVARLPAKGLRAAFAGISGAMTGAFRERFGEYLRELLPDAGAVAVHGDVVSALTGGIGRGAGCLVISGTGCVAYARPTAGDNESLIRSGGWGHLLDKGGSGYDLGRDVLYCALCARDGRGPDTFLRELAEQRLGCPVTEAIGGIYEGGKAYIASFAPLVFKALEMGDPVAQEVMDRNMAELARALNSVAAQLPGDGPCRTVLAGSVFRGFEVMEPYVTPRLTRKHRFILPGLPPVYGSAIEALALAGLKAGEGFAAAFEKGIREGEDTGRLQKHENFERKIEKST